MGLLLSVLASILKWAFQPVMYGYGTVKSLYRGEFSKYNQQLAIAKDRHGNVLAQYLFNDLFIKKEGYKYGNGKETISSVFGKNKRDNTLSIAGKGFDKILDFFDKNHSLDSIDNTIQ